MVKSPLCYMGGKYHIANWIASHFPPHKLYVDVFGGAAHVLCAKAPASLEIYNDLDGDLTNLFEIIRTKPRDFVRRFRYLMYSERIYRWCVKESDLKEPVERAVLYFFKLRACFAGRITQRSFGHGHKGGCSNAKSYRTALRLIPAMAERLAEVEIHNQDFRHEITRCDSADTLFYLDPPYMMQNAGNGRYYTFDFAEQDHYALAELLRSIKGMAVLSYYPHPVLDEIYKQWACYEIQTVAYSSRITRHSTSRIRSRRTERLYCNFQTA